MDNTEKAFDNAIDSSKQLITLSTGIIAFSVAFFDKEAMMKPANNIEKLMLILSWIILLSSAMVGILWTHRSFISELKPSKKEADSTSKSDSAETHPKHEPDIRSDKIRYPLNLQSRLFLAGIISFIIFGIVKVFNNKSESITMSIQQQPDNSGHVKNTSNSLILKSDSSKNKH